jgi:hypothetical protein
MFVMFVAPAGGRRWAAAISSGPLNRNWLRRGPPQRARWRQGGLVQRNATMRQPNSWRPCSRCPATRGILSPQRCRTSCSLRSSAGTPAIWRKITRRRGYFSDDSLTDGTREVTVNDANDRCPGETPNGLGAGAKRQDFIHWILGAASYPLSGRRNCWRPSHCRAIGNLVTTQGLGNNVAPIIGRIGVADIDVAVCRDGEGGQPRLFQA